MKKLTLMISFLSVFAITNAQMDENIILDSVTIQKNELKVTPEIEEMLVAKVKELPERFHSEHGIKNKEQLEKLRIGKPIPVYEISNGELKFTDLWNVPVLSDGELLFSGLYPTLL